MPFNIILLIAISAIAVWLAWREWRLRRLLDRAATAVRTDSANALEALSNDLEHAPAELHALLRNTVDAAAESELAVGSRSFQLSFFEALLNQIEDALFVLDDDLTIRFSNRAASGMFAAESPHEGRSLIEVCLDHRIVDTANLAAQADGKVQEHVQRKTSGARRSMRTYLVEAEPLSTAGKRGGTWLLVRDITDKLEIEQIRRDFVANASHELRTPLSIINGYLEMLDGDPPPEKPLLKRAVQTMSTHAERIIRIVDDMLTISRLESSDSLLHLERFDLKECVIDTVEQLQPIIDRQGAKVAVDFPEEAFPIDGDRFYWNQVFFNLIENALKQNADRPLKIRITASREKGRQRITVNDNGVGIPAADVPHIFKRFYRVDKHHSQARKGTGLGLSIVKRAVEAHDGTIRVKSRPGTRTSFEIEVPETSASTAAAVAGKESQEDSDAT